MISRIVTTYPLPSTFLMWLNIRTKKNLGVFKNGVPKKTVPWNFHAPNAKPRGRRFTIDVNVVLSVWKKRRCTGAPGDGEGGPTGGRLGGVELLPSHWEEDPILFFGTCWWDFLLPPMLWPFKKKLAGFFFQCVSSYHASDFFLWISNKDWSNELMNVDSQNGRPTTRFFVPSTYWLIYVCCLILRWEIIRKLTMNKILTYPST